MSTSAFARRFMAEIPADQPVTARRAGHSAALPSRYLPYLVRDLAAEGLVVWWPAWADEYDGGHLDRVPPSCRVSVVRTSAAVSRAARPRG